MEAAQVLKQTRVLLATKRAYKIRTKQTILQNGSELPGFLTQQSHSSIALLLFIQGWVFRNKK